MRLIPLLSCLILSGLTSISLRAESSLPPLINAASKQIAVAIDPIQLPLIAEAEVTLRFRLKEKTEQSISPDRLHNFDDSKIHLIAIDPTYTDLHFLLPVFEKETKAFTVAFIPNTSGPYRFYVETQDASTRSNFAGTFDLGGPFASSFSNDTPLSSRAGVNGYDFSLLGAFDDTLPLGQHAQLRLQITKNDQALTTLESVMKELGHLIAFLPETGQMIHLRPSKNLSPSSPSVSKSELRFDITPVSPEKMPLFFVVRLDRSLQIIPFVLGIFDPKSKEHPEK